MKADGVAWVIGSGSSLDKMDLSLIRRPILAVNMAVILFPICWWTVRDPRVWGRMRKSKHLFHAEIFFDGRNFAKIVQEQFRDQIDEYVPGPKVFLGSTVVVSAIQILELLGFEGIMLAGIDLATIDGRAYSRGTAFLQKRLSDSQSLKLYGRHRRSLMELREKMQAFVATTSKSTADIFPYVAYENAVSL